MTDSHRDTGPSWIIWNMGQHLIISCFHKFTTETLLTLSSSDGSEKGFKKGRRFFRCRAEVPCSQERPRGTTWSSSPYAAMVEPIVQQRMRPGAAAVNGQPPQDQTWFGVAAMERSPRWGRKAGGAAVPGDCMEQRLKDGPCGTELHWSSAWRAVAFGKITQYHLGKDGIPWGRPMDRGREWPRRSKHKVLWADQNPFSVLLYWFGRESRREWMDGRFI